MKIFAIIVTYNGMRWYDRCFGSLQNSDMPIETIVIDNASTDETVSYIKEHFPKVCLIESKENLGFAKANNIGIKHALDNGADYVFLLNQDAWVEEDTLSKLVQTFDENENVGIASPIHLNGSYSGMDWGFINNCIPNDFIFDSYMRRLKKNYFVNYVNAAAWLITVECINKVGGFDTLLFKHYGEDNNYCQRVLYHGYKIVINTATTICHDREKRKGNESKYRKKVFKPDPFLILKCDLGDINVDVDYKKYKRTQWRSIVKSLLRLSMGEVVNSFKRIKLISAIMESRICNINGGKVWLDV